MFHVFLSRASVYLYMGGFQKEKIVKKSYEINKGCPKS